MLSQEYIHYAENDYPSNHRFTISDNGLKPKCKLNLRYRKIKKLYPHPLTSLLDVSCSKGFFVFSSAMQETCERSLGIDINEYDVNFCLALKTHLKRDKVNFLKLRLHELAARINEFGGPFQTVLLINAYQYFYFGSDRARDCYLDHEIIFKYLSIICAERIIFNNRITVADCQNQKYIHSQQKSAQHYSREGLIAGACKYFKVTDQGYIGRYPLLVFDKL